MESRRHHHKERTVYCQQCGRPLADDESTCPHCQGSSGADDLACYRALVGEKRQAYYLRHFAHFDGAGKTSASWNWPAFLITFYWLLYRKLWLPALLYFLLPYAFVAINPLANAIHPLLSALLNLLFALALFIVPPLYANALYYRHCRKQMAKVRAREQSRERQLTLLAARGGTSSIAIVVMALLLIAMIGIIAAIALPAYQTYTLRMQTSQVEYLGRETTKSLSAYYEANLTLPESLQQANIAPTASPLIRRMALDAGSGELAIELKQKSLEGKHLLFTPIKEQDGSLSWRCHSPDIRPAYLSEPCRGEKPAP